MIELNILTLIVLVGISFFIGFIVGIWIDPEHLQQLKNKMDELEDDDEKYD